MPKNATVLMPDKYLYLLVDFFCIVFPFIFSLTPWFHFKANWRYFALPCLVTGVFFAVWDSLFVELGIWHFNYRYCVGLQFGGLPLEEFLFFLCIPYACTFTYYCIDRYWNINRFSAFATSFTWLVFGFLTVTGILHYQKLYTSVTFLLLAVLLVVLQRAKAQWLATFYTTFLLIMIPFFISNGILTGAFTPEPVVIYNNNHNLGIRMITIPFEDTFYGMLLLLMNVAGYEYLKAQDKAKQKSIT